MSETNIFDDLFQMFINDINDVMVRVLASNTIDPRLESHDRVRVRVRVRVKPMTIRCVFAASLQNMQH